MCVYYNIPALLTTLGRHFVILHLCTFWRVLQQSFTLGEMSHWCQYQCNAGSLAGDYVKDFIQVGTGRTRVKVVKLDS